MEQGYHNAVGSRFRQREVFFSAFFVALFLLTFSFFAYVSAAPEGPTSISVVSNQTKSPLGGQIVNTSGGYITTLNITAVTQNVRWKAFIGWVSGRFTLNDASGSTIYDWSLSNAAITGEVYATRNASTIAWSRITCANTSILQQENFYMNHSNPDDNITRTFTGDTTHASFSIGAVTLSANACPTLNTYINNATQTTDFEEIALYDGLNTSSGGNVVFATILEQDRVGYNNQSYDFQMIVPENGHASFSGSTAYYLYVELS